MINKMVYKMKFHIERAYIFLCKIICFPFPVKNNKVVFINYHGKGYGDNLKYIANELLEDPSLELVWIVRKDLDISKMDLPKQIKIAYYNSLSGIFEMSTAKVWIANCRKMFCSFKKKSQYYIQTWHAGLALKKVEGDALDKLDWRYRLYAKRDTRYADLMISNSKICTEMYRRAFWYDGEILECGSPRNDILVNNNQDIRRKVRKKIGISETTAIVLYAPTFRNLSDDDPYLHNFEDVKKAFETYINQNQSESYDNVAIFLRLHPNMTDMTGKFQLDSNVVDVSLYADLQELLVACDYLISDYSSTSIEFSMQYKPVFLYMIDYKEYQKERGLFFQVEDLPYIITYSYEDLLNSIQTFDKNKYIDNLRKFFEKVNLKETGNASSTVADRIRKVCLK